LGFGPKGLIDVKNWIFFKAIVDEILLDSIDEI